MRAADPDRFEDAKVAPRAFADSLLRSTEVVNIPREFVTRKESREESLRPHALQFTIGTRAKDGASILIRGVYRVVIHKFGDYSVQLEITDLQRKGLALPGRKVEDQPLDQTFQLGVMWKRKETVSMHLSFACEASRDHVRLCLDAAAGPCHDFEDPNSKCKPGPPLDGAHINMPLPPSPHDSRAAPSR
jgi:hypothetical protein